MTQPKKFEIDIPAARIDDIKRRVSAYPWSTFKVPLVNGQGDEWSYGPPPSYMEKLCEHWSTKYDWPTRQARMNALPQYTANVQNLSIHFVHERSSGRRENLAVLLLHGWPYSFHSFHEVVQRLAHPERFGGKTEDGVDVVVPSMSGYDFSSAPESVMGPKAITHVYNELMAGVLGYDRYAAHGGDWGSYISELLGFHHGDHCVAIHITMSSVRHHGAAARSGGVSGEAAPDASEEEKAFAEDEMKRWEPESGYSKLQLTKPTKLGYAMADSPVGVAGWIVEAFHAWSDLSNGRRFEEVYDFDDLLDEVMLYLVTDAFHTSTWIYVGEGMEGSNTLPPGEQIAVPVGVLALPDPVLPMPPKSVLEKSRTVVSYTQASRGGHFPFYEARDELVMDLRAFVLDQSAS